MNIFTIEIPEQRTAFVFGRQVAQLPVTFEAAYYPTDDETKRPAFVLSLSTLAQQIEIWPTQAEIAALIRFLHNQLKHRANCPHQISDE